MLLTWTTGTCACAICFPSRKNANFLLSFIADKFVIDSESDMLMEPDEHTPEEVNPYAIETRVVYSTSSSRPSGFRPIVPIARQDFITPEAEHSTARVENTPAEQNFFPFYRSSPPLGHSRPFYQPQTEQQFATERYSQVPRSHSARSAFDQTILGSGDFSVIHGGTFYQEDDPPLNSYSESEYYNVNYNQKGHNGHGRPQAAPLIQKLRYPEDQFANFRDFADINTPADPAFSHFVVVYANKNATVEETAHKSPKNIIEQLELLDREKEAEERQKKLSKNKLKLAKTKIAEKKYKKQMKLVKTTTTPSTIGDHSQEHDEFDDFMLALS
jgi:hypothetical protein